MIVHFPLLEVPDGGATTVSLNDGRVIGLFRVGDQVAAINNRCPHRGAALATGTFDGTNVKCPLHSFVVNVWTGIGSGGKPVDRYAVAVHESVISIEV